MKLAIALILALVCHMAIGEVPRACQTTSQYWDGNTCNPCPDPCKECVYKDRQVSCISCGFGTGKYLADDGTCKDCTANCKTCRGPNVADCKEPTSQDLVISPTQIVKCTGVDGCLWCSQENVCGRCKLGYRLADGKCTPCQNAFCADCSDSISTCKKCAYWYTLNNTSCSSCDPGCTACPCKGCKAGYSYKDNTCIACKVLFCTDCSKNQSSCTKCPVGRYLNTTTNSCTKCVDNCAECTGDEKCSKCEPYFGLNGTKTCTECPTNCKDCNGVTGECSNCLPGFYMSRNKKKCTKCPDGCDGCGTDGVCHRCLDGFWPNHDAIGCSPCKTGCQQCIDANRCRTCQLGYLADDKDGCKSFFNCKFGEQLNGTGHCVPGTIDNCAYGNNVSGSCVQCADGYTPKDKAAKTCVPCPKGCKECYTDEKEYISCLRIAQPGYSATKNSNGKADTTGYLGKDIIFTVDADGKDTSCMPNNFLATYTNDQFKHKCVAYDQCSLPQKAGRDWNCLIQGASTASKMAFSLFAVAIATLFTL